jgi:chemotaxis protein methyltransferase CheR
MVLDGVKADAMELSLSDGLFRKFSDMVYEHCGINLHDGKKALLQARLNKRLRVTEVTSYEDYYRYLTNPHNDGELTQFLDCISTNLTYFFRESQHFDFLKQRLLPELIELKRKARTNRIRIWSAGCSTGEEPYSLAMYIASQMEDLPKWDLRILATDISTRVLAVASRGIYSRSKIAGIPESIRRSYFQPCCPDKDCSDFQIVSPIRSLTTFRRLNLKDPYPFKGPFDFIFCRNVMIYFDKQTQEALIQRMASYLVSGGYLFVGHAESLTGLNHPLSYVRPAVYRK